MSFAEQKVLAKWVRSHIPILIILGYHICPGCTAQAVLWLKRTDFCGFAICILFFSFR